MPPSIEKQSNRLMQIRMECGSNARIVKRDVLKAYRALKQAEKEYDDLRIKVGEGSHWSNDDVTRQARKIKGLSTHLARLKIHQDRFETLSMTAKEHEQALRLSSMQMKFMKTANAMSSDPAMLEHIETEFQSAVENMEIANSMQGNPIESVGESDNLEKEIQAASDARLRARGIETATPETPKEDAEAAGQALEEQQAQTVDRSIKNLLREHEPAA